MGALVRPKVDTKPVEDQTAGQHEKIVAVSVEGTSCLVSIRDLGAGEMVLEVYAADPGVTVRGPQPSGS